MKILSLASLALLSSLSEQVLAAGHHFPMNKLRHVARSPWGDSQAAPPGYDSCVQQCMAGGGSWDSKAAGGEAPSQAGGSDSTAAAAAPLATNSDDSPIPPPPGSSSSPPDSWSDGASAYGDTSKNDSSSWAGAGGGYGGMAPSPGGANGSSSVNSTGLVPGPFEVIVAPKQGDLRMVPFNIQVPVGQNITFIFGAGPHTVTQSSLVTICNASNAEGAFKSGQQMAGFKYSVQVKLNKTQPYFCAVPGHCQKGMFGLINGLTIETPEGSLGEAMPKMAANDSSLKSMWDETKTMCKDSPSAWSWGDKLAMSQFPDWTLTMAMENVLRTRQFLATSPPGASNSSSASLSSPATTGSLASAPSSSSTSEPSSSTRSTSIKIAVTVLFTVLSLLVVVMI
ncbi:uncharacterized protein JCM6883_003776 [Sporobolomyces salmoneus]|uniref:uncharacterized protein n=1 Tax=Sporobolomyces salmoneus TaxID=183962 RepID=UPI00317D01AA